MHFGNGLWLYSDFHVFITSKPEQNSVVPTGSVYIMI